MYYRPSIFRCTSRCCRPNFPVDILQAGCVVSLPESSDSATLPQEGSNTSEPREVVGAGTSRVIRADGDWAVSDEGAIVSPLLTMPRTTCGGPLDSLIPTSASRIASLDHGYEARQARRHSDKGLRQLARLITSNWIVHTVPTLEVFLAQQTNGSFAVTLRATRQHFVDMREVTIHDVRDRGDGVPQRTPRQAELLIEERPAQPGPPARAAHVVTTLGHPLVLPAPEPGEPIHFRLEWRGEAWPRFVLSIVGNIDEKTCITSQTLGAVMQVSLELLGAH